MKLNLNSQDYKILAAICLTVTGTMSLNDMLLPSLPAITIALNTKTAIVQQSLALFFMGQAASIFICGPISDMWGRKNTMLMGLGFTLAVSFCLIFVNSIETYLYLKLLQGLGSGVGMGLGRVIMVDYFKQKSLIKVASIFSMSALVSPLIMPSIGGYIQESYGWQANLLVSAIELGIVIILFNFLCIETNLKKTKPNMKALISNYKIVITDKKFICWTLLNSVCVASYYSYTVVSPFLFQNFYKFSPLEFGYTCAIITSANFMSKSILIVIADKCNKHYTTKLSAIAIAIIGFCLYFTSDSASSTIVLLFIFMLVIGFATPIMSTQALAKFDHIRGIAGALYSSIILIITAVVCNIVGILPDRGLSLLSMTFIALGIFSIFVSYILAKLDD
jgi:MFS family permease